MLWVSPGIGAILNLPEKGPEPLLFSSAWLYVSRIVKVCAPDSIDFTTGISCDVREAGSRIFELLRAFDTQSMVLAAAEPGRLNTAFSLSSKRWPSVSEKTMDVQTSMEPGSSWANRRMTG